MDEVAVGRPRDSRIGEAAAGDVLTGAGGPADGVFGDRDLEGRATGSSEVLETPGGSVSELEPAPLASFVVAGAEPPATPVPPDLKANGIATTAPIPTRMTARITCIREIRADARRRP